MKRIIFHVPFKLDSTTKSASGIRPLQMLQAFKKIGFTVDVIEGLAKDRKKAIKKIKRNINMGIKYDFCYSESSTQPTLHTQPYSFIKYPFFEFTFFRFLKKHNIKIGLFYRDIYWCFPSFVNTWKKKFYRLLYRYDLYQYNKYVDTLFIPSLEMVKYIPISLKPNLVELPPGTNIKSLESTKKNSDTIEMIYVGGVGNHYDLTMVCKVLNNFPNIHLVICCREIEWNKIKANYTSLLSNNIEIIHKSGKELELYYHKADIGLLFILPTHYWTFAMPYKMFEFIGYGLPVLTSFGTKCAEFIKTNSCGYIVKYNEEALYNFFKGITHNKLLNTRKKVKQFALTQTWEERVKEVAINLA